MRPTSTRWPRATAAGCARTAPTSAAGPRSTRPGTQDITADLLLPPLRRAIHRAGLTLVTETDQAAWLRDVGLEALVDEGRAAWEAGAARGDLAALAGRSRVTEAAALTDPGGLGAHTVLVLAKGVTRPGR